MPSHKTQPPWDFLLSASRNSLQSYELSRLSHAANLRKEISALIDQWMEETSAALLARWLMEHRERELIATGLAAVQPREEAQPVSDNLFADRAIPSRQVRGAS